MYPNSQTAQQCNTYPQTNLELALMLMARLNSNELTIVKSLIETFSKDGVTSPISSDFNVTTTDIKIVQGQEAQYFLENGAYRGFPVPLSIKLNWYYSLVVVKDRKYIFESSKMYPLDVISRAAINPHELISQHMGDEPHFKQLNILDGVMYSVPLNSYDETPETNTPNTDGERLLWILDSDPKFKVYDGKTALPEYFIKI